MANQMEREKERCEVVRVHEKISGAIGDLNKQLWSLELEVAFAPPL